VHSLSEYDPSVLILTETAERNLLKDFKRHHQWRVDTEQRAQNYVTQRAFTPKMWGQWMDDHGMVILTNNDDDANTADTEKTQTFISQSTCAPRPPMTDSVPKTWTWLKHGLNTDTD